MRTAIPINNHRVFFSAVESNGSVASAIEIGIIFGFDGKGLNILLISAKRSTSSAGFFSDGNDSKWCIKELDQRRH